MGGIAVVFAGCEVVPEIPNATFGGMTEGDGDDDDDDPDTTTGPELTTSVSNSDPTTPISAEDSGTTTTTGGTTELVISTGETLVVDTTTSGSSSSTAFDDEDVQCDGPEGDDMCDTPSPYDGTGDCDPYLQDCPMGQKCLAWADDGGTTWNATRCSDVPADPDQLGDSCTVVGSGTSGEDSCDVGLMCWNVSGSTGTCIEVCGCGPDEPTCSSGGTLCSISNDNALTICLPTCDPLGYDGTEDPCPDGEVCVPQSGWFLCAPDVSGGAGTAGADCQYLNDCSPGHMCVNAASYPGCAGTGCCAEFCDLDTGNSECTDAGTACTSFFGVGGEPEECHEDTGVCLEP